MSVDGILLKGMMLMPSPYLDEEFRKVGSVDADR